MPTISQSGQNAQLALTWLGWADDDYLAARTLLLQNLLVQGAAFSNTAVEKYFKTLFTLRALSIPHTHNIVSLHGQIKASGITLNLNEQYLQLLVEAYKMRYPDDLETGFNIAMVQTKMLVELDATVHTIRKGFGFQQGDKRITTRFDVLLANKDTQLLDRNCYFGAYDRRAIFQEQTGCYEIRITGPGPETLQATYLASGVKDDGVFNTEALKPGAPSPPA